MQTKTVEGFFGPKQISRKEFVARWKAVAVDCCSIAVTTADYAAICDMTVEIEEMAGRKWDAMPD